MDLDQSLRELDELFGAHESAVQSIEQAAQARQAAVSQAGSWEAFIASGLKSQVNRMLAEVTRNDPVPRVEPAFVQVRQEPSPQVTCAACRTVLSANAKFCEACGAPVVVQPVCTSCRRPIRAGAKFCGACGARQS